LWLNSAVTKPVVGVLDAAQDVSMGIRNTTNLEEHDIGRARLPRAFGQDGILKTFNEHEALGVNLMRTVDDNKYNVK
jgi:vacuolar protein sorting-associated protein 13A/C